MQVRRPLLSCLLAAGLGLAALSAKADVLLNFNINNVVRHDCAGALQPVCTTEGAASFTQQLRINTAALGSVDNNAPGFLETEGSYGYPTLMGLSPYTAELNARLTGPVGFAQSFTSAGNFFDGGGGVGQSWFQVYSDSNADYIGAGNAHFQQEYSLNYSFNSALFNDFSFYTDLVNGAVDDLLLHFANGLASSYQELGVASAFNPDTLLLDTYLYTQMTGDVTLASVVAVPEPAAFALFLLALATLAAVRTARR